MVLDLRLTKIGCRDDNQFFLFIYTLKQIAKHHSIQTSPDSAAGFQELRETDPWAVKPGSRCYVVKNGTAVVAFVAGSDPAAGFRIVAAHSDSPGFRVKPHPEMRCGALGP